MPDLQLAQSLSAAESLRLLLLPLLQPGASVSAGGADWPSIWWNVGSLTITVSHNNKLCCVKLSFSDTPPNINTEALENKPHWDFKCRIWSNTYVQWNTICKTLLISNKKVIQKVTIKTDILSVYMWKYRLHTITVWGSILPTGHKCKTHVFYWPLINWF